MSLRPFVHVDHPLEEARSGTEVALSDADAHRLRTVLRLRPDAAVQVADGLGGCAPARLGEDTLRLTADATHVAWPQPRLVVAQALTKGRKLDDVVRVTTELGTDAITVVAASRSVARPDPKKAEMSLDRWHAVARAACEQSRRPHRPSVDGPVTPAELVATHGAGATLLIAHPGGDPLPTALGDLRREPQITIAIGPEGGWTADEVAAMRASGGRTIGLGPTVLRTEHAAAAALAVLSAELGRWTTPPPAL